MWLLVALFVCWGILTLTFCMLIVHEYKIPEDTKMSIRESMDLVNLPVVTFENGGNKFNFIIDTGANDSLINESCENILVAPQKTKNSIRGIIGDNKECHVVLIEFTYKNNTFESMFNVVNLDELFNTIKKEYGVLIHGILGTKFLDKYNYVIDFKDYIIYKKK